MSDTANKCTTGNMSGFRTLFTVCLLLCCVGVATADNRDDRTDVAPSYIDDVNSWGTWELGIEPAAGPQAATSQVIPVRSANIQFRPNDNATFRPNGQEITTNMPMPDNPPPPIPTIPPGTAQGATGAPPPTGDPRNR